ncbi:MAG: hypothetical protein LBH46_01825 [Rickettsiales bacterium]|jgi:hypothetical protein|nr:hypothetical protein [Rickettsiales bacterium]
MAKVMEKYFNGTMKILAYNVLGVERGDELLGGTMKQERLQKEANNKHKADLEELERKKKNQQSNSSDKLRSTGFDKLDNTSLDKLENNSFDKLDNNSRL